MIFSAVIPLAVLSLASPLKSANFRDAALNLKAQAQFEVPNMMLNRPFDRGVPEPENVLGYRIGSKITTYRDQERVMQSILAASGGKAARIEYGASNQGFPLRVYAISTKENIANWSKIRATLEESAKKGTPPPAGTPAVVWVNETIHGNEPASFESGMMLMYNLVAGGGEYSRALKNVIVILNPVYNPDGHERFAVSYNSYARGHSEPGSFESYEVNLLWGRFNQYRFDMNRDRVSFSQVETQQEVKLMQSIRPQVYLDQHGQVQNYFFPPNPMSINANVDRNRLNKWTEILGRACASEFDQAGWSYFIREDFDLYYPGYLDAHATLSGAIGITHETDGGKVLAKTRDDGSVVTLREGAAKHLVSALACIKASSERSKELLADWANYKQNAVTGKHAGEFQRVIVIDSDPRPLLRLQQQLAKTGVEAKFATQSFKQPAKDYYGDSKAAATEQEFPMGSLIIDMNQEYGPVAKALLEINSDFEPEFIESQMKKAKTAPEGESYPGPESTEFYDLTGWALPFAHNLKAFYSEQRPDVKTQSGWKFDTRFKKGSVGYVLNYRDQNDVLAIHDLLSAGVKISVARADMDLKDQRVAKGSFLIFSIRNQDVPLDSIIQKIAENRQVEFLPLNTSYPESGREGPGNRLTGLRVPKIGVVFGSGAQISGVSGTWFNMDQNFKLPFVALSSTGLNSAKLPSYSVLVAPSGSGVASNTKVKDWVRDGGVLMVVGENPSSIATFESNSSKTRSVPGSIFRADLESRSVLAYGYAGKELAVPVEGDSFYRTRKEGGSVVSFAKDAKSKLLTGWSWGEETEKALQGSVWMHDEPLGQGHIVWFSFDPNERAMWPGLSKLFLNALIVLPGN